MIGIEDIVGSVQSAQSHYHPFPHLRFSGVFGDKDYREILHSLPPDDAYAELRHKDARLPDGSFSRLVFPLTGENIERLDPGRREYWGTLASTLRLPDVARALAAKFSGLGLQVPPETGSVLRLSLVRDLPGYFIRPHQDIPSKIVTAQIYLPRDGRGSDFGTNFYRRGETGKLKLDVSVPFLPNTGYAFAVADDSWHGVNPIPADADARDSLMLVWYVRGGAAKLGALKRSLLRRLRSGGRPPSVLR